MLIMIVQKMQQLIDSARRKGLRCTLSSAEALEDCIKAVIAEWPLCGGLVYRPHYVKYDRSSPPDPLPLLYITWDNSNADNLSLSVGVEEPRFSSPPRRLPGRYEYPEDLILSGYPFSARPDNLTMWAWAAPGRRKDFRPGNRPGVYHQVDGVWVLEGLSPNREVLSIARLGYALYNDPHEGFVCKKAAEPVVCDLPAAHELSALRGKVVLEALESMAF